MAKYQITLEGMECKACAELISMELEDNQFSNININLDKNIAEFESNMDENEVKLFLSKIFRELDKYSYSDLKTL
jgi:hypothetical protein